MHLLGSVTRECMNVLGYHVYMTRWIAININVARSYSSPAFTI